MKPLIAICLVLLTIICQAQQPFSISFELSNGLLRDTVTVGYNPIATNVIDPQLNEVDITGTPYKQLDIRSIAMPNNCIIDTSFAGFSAQYETKLDYKPGFKGLKSRYVIGQPVYGWSVQQFDSNTFYFRCVLPPQRSTLTIIDQLNNNSRSYYELTIYYNSFMPNCIAFAILPLTSNISPGNSIFEFNTNSSQIDTNIIIAFTRFNLRTSLPRTLDEAKIKLHNHTLTATTAIKPDRIEVVDYLGRVLHQGHWSTERSDYELPFREGIWFLRLYFGEQATVVKIYIAG